MTLDRTWVIATGQEIEIGMPDLMTLADNVVDIPNAVQADMYILLYGREGKPSTPMEQLEADRRQLRGMIGIAQMVIKRPRLVLDDEERKEGDLSIQDLTWSDITGLYQFFRLGPFVRSTPPQSEDTATDTQPVNHGGNVPQGSE
jgi:hypothetical protein